MSEMNAVMFYGPKNIKYERVKIPEINDNEVLVKVDTDRNLMLVKGAVPGGKGSLVRIQYAVKGQDK